jgi:WD40 repeat protein
VSDDDRQGHFMHMAQRHAAQQRRQPPTPKVSRIQRFSGTFAAVRWHAMGWTADGSLLALGGRDARGGRLEIWNDHGHREGHGVRYLVHDVAGPVTALAWSPDGARLATVEETGWGGESEVRIRDRSGLPEILRVPPNLPVSQVAWSPDGASYVLSSPGGPAAQADAASGTLRPLLGGLSGPVAWEPQGRLVAAVDGTSVVLGDPLTGMRRQTLSGQHVPSAVAWARHGRYLAVAAGDEIRVWDTQLEQQLWKLPWTTSEGDRGPDGTVTGLEWLDGGHYLMEFRPRGGAWRDELGSTVSTSILWDITTGKSLLVELFYERIAGVIQPLAASVMTPAGNRFTHAIDSLAPTIWQLNLDLPHFLP